MIENRFILSAGHGVNVIYSLLHLKILAMTVSMEDLKNFRQTGSKTTCDILNME